MKDLDAIGWAIATIQSKIARPQPDSDTGLVPCGCGGKAELCQANDYYTARCERCRTTSDYYKTAEETIAAWNKAMGYTNTTQGQ